MFREFETVVPRKKREDLRYRWKLSSLLIFLADTETSISDWAEMKGVERWAEQVKLYITYQEPLLVTYKYFLKLINCHATFLGKKRYSDFQLNS